MNLNFFGNNCKDGWKQQAKLILANNAAGSYRTAQQTKATVQNMTIHDRQFKALFVSSGFYLQIRNQQKG
jgi:hypothetical protein